jgi:hypothetical protein
MEKNESKIRKKNRVYLKEEYTRSNIMADTLDIIGEPPLLLMRSYHSGAAVD